MSNGLGVAVMLPGSSAPASVTCTGAVQGGTVLQVLNLVTGADVTSSFDPYIPGADTLIQLDTTPYAPMDGKVYQASGPTLSSVAFILLVR